MAAHENYDRPEKIKLGSDKNFSLTFAVVFLALGVVPLLSRHVFRWWAFALSAVFLIIALTRPSLLKHPNRLWAQFGLLLNRIVSPVILSVLFFAAFLPVGLLLKLFGKDVLDMKINRHAKSYWIKSASSNTSMQDQF